MYLSNSNFHLPCFHICFEKNFPEQMNDLNGVAFTADQPFLFEQETFLMLHVTSVSTTSHFLNVQEKQLKSLHEHSCCNAPLNCCKSDDLQTVFWILEGLPNTGKSRFCHFFLQ